MIKTALLLEQMFVFKNVTELYYYRFSWKGKSTKKRSILKAFYYLYIYGTLISFNFLEKPYVYII